MVVRFIMIGQTGGRKTRKPRKIKPNLETKVQNDEIKMTQYLVTKTTQ